MLEFLAMLSIGKIFDAVWTIAKSYFITFYIGVVDFARSIYFTLVLTIACLMLLLSGFIMLHVALFLYLPWTLSSKIIGITVLGSIYVIAPLMLLMWIQSRDRWLKMTGAKKMLDDATKK